MKSIIVALGLATFAALAFAAQPQRTFDAGESDFAVKTRIAGADNTYYRNQAGEEDKHQPQVGG